MHTCPVPFMQLKAYTHASVYVCVCARTVRGCAQICQQEGLVPIVEPEVTLGPGDYSIEETAFWSERVYSHVFRLLNEYDIMLDGILLKPNM